MTEHGTAIGWTHVPGYKGETWNPTTGCDRVTPGCAHCYALDFAERLKGMGQKRYQRDGDPKTSGPGFGLTLHPDKLEEPLRWKKPRAVFVNSMSDAFHEEIPVEFTARMFAAMAAAPRHIFMVLTKRPERMKAMVNSMPVEMEWVTGEMVTEWPLPNVWLGVTIENRRFVQRADLLRQTPAAIRFISAEPLLGPLIAPMWVDDTKNVPAGGLIGSAKIAAWEDGSTILTHPSLDLTNIDWVITGGESGPKHRRFDPAWATALRLQAEEEGIAFFHKQNGGASPTSGGRLLNGRTWDEFPTTAAAGAGTS